jgi:Ras-related protein Rab-7A
VLGNKIDKEKDRKVHPQKAEQWAKENGDIPYFETSAIENVSVDDAFITMAKMAIKRES